MKKTIFQYMNQNSNPMTHSKDDLVYFKTKPPYVWIYRIGYKRTDIYVTSPHTLTCGLHSDSVVMLVLLWLSLIPRSITKSQENLCGQGFCKMSSSCYFLPLHKWHGFWELAVYHQSIMSLHISSLIFHSHLVSLFNDFRHKGHYKISLSIWIKIYGFLNEILGTSE